MSTNFLIRSRHKSIYYFRRRIPIDISHNFENDLLLKSLNTTNKRLAVILARSLASQTDILFEKIRAMNKKTNDNFLASYVLKVDLNDKNQLTSISIDAEPHETQSVQAVISTLMSTNNADQNSPPTAHKPPQASIGNFQSFIDEYYKEVSLKPSTLANYKSKLECAKEYFGENYNLLNADQLSIVNLAKHVKARISNPTTQGLYIQIIVTFVNWHRRRHGLSDLHSKSLIPNRKTPKHLDREAFSLNDMRTIFNNAFQYSRKEPYKWWSTIAVAFMGCRIEEICQVNLHTDLVWDKEEKIWYLKFDEEPDSDGVVRKSLKKLSSWRQLPIHSALVKHGFIDYLHLQKKKGASRPFQIDWAPRTVAKTGIIKWSQYATKWGGRELDKLANTGSIVRSDKTYFHSMRHTMAKMMQDANVTSEISEAIAGRSAGIGEHERYGKIKNNYLLLSREGIEKALNPLVDILESVINNNH